MKIKIPNNSIRRFLVFSLLYGISLVVFSEDNVTENKTSWIHSLPSVLQRSVLWYADHEEGSLYDWEYDDPENSGGGIFCTGLEDEVYARVVTNISFSGKHSVEASIRNAYRSQNGNKAVRLLRWTDKPWDDGGKYFPRSAYFSAWMMIPENYNPNKEPPWDPGDGGWWNVFQFKSDNSEGESEPVWVLNIMRDIEANRMYLCLYSNENMPHSYDIKSAFLPVGEWFHLEAFYKQSGFKKKNGKIIFWLNGQEVFRKNRVVTRLKGQVIWGIGNYTDHIDGGAVPGSATVYFDDALVSKKPVHIYLKKHFRRKNSLDSSGGRPNSYP